MGTKPLIITVMSAPKTKVLLIDSSPMFSGAQRVLLRVLRPLLAQGSLDLIAWCRGEMAQALRDEGIRVFEEPLPFLMPGYDNPIAAWRLAQGLKKLAKERAAGRVVYANGVHSGIAAAFLGLSGPGVKVHARDVLRPRPPTLATYRWMAAKGFSFAGVSGVVSQNIQELSGKSARTLYDPAPEFLSERELVHQVKKLVFVGNLIHFKGPDLLLKALALLPGAQTQHLSLDLIGPELAGHEPYAAEVKSLAAAMSFPCRVLGRQENVMEKMRAYDLAILPSTWPDPFPGVVLETVASFTPLVATRVGGVPEMLPHEGGPAGPWLANCEATDLAKVLSLAISSTAEERLLRLQASRDWAIQHFSQKKILTDTLEFLQNSPIS